MKLPVDQAIRAAATSDLDTSFFLEAGAGTGKTRILVDRVVEIVRRGAAPIQEVVVITFTEKAAGELRARIRDRLHEHLNGASEPERTRYQAALRNLVSAHIETIHAFASSLLREFPLEARIDPGFQQLDAVGSDVDLQERWDDWIWSVTGAQLAAVERCLRLGLTLATVRQGAQILDGYRELKLSPGPPPPRPARALLENMLSILDQAETVAGACIRSSDRCLASYHALRRGVAAAQQASAAAPPSRREAVVEAALHALSFRRDRGNRSNWRPPERLEQMRQLLETAQEQLTRFHDSLNESALQHLTQALTGFVNTAARGRRREGKLNFDDLLIEARSLVANHPTVRAALQDRIRFLLVDEFQDTDPLQAELVFLLAGSDPPAPHADAAAPDWRNVSLAPGKLFIVGDPKQSIYRFRRADIDTYLAAKQVFSEQPAGRTRVATVSQNFRSRPEITTWVNETFAPVLTANRAFPGAQPEYRPIHAYRDPAAEPRVVLVYPEAPLTDIRLPELRAAEATAVARVVADLVDNPAWQIADEGGQAGDLRRISFRDICILVDSRTEIKRYTSQLKARQVPYILDGGQEFFQRQEVRDLTAILRAIDDPSDQVALVAALKSDAFCCSDVELLEYRAAGGRFSLLARDQPDSAVGRALTRLHARYQDKSTLTLPFLVDRAIRESFLVEPILHTGREHQRAANLKFIVERAAEFAVNEADALRPFVRWLTQRKEGRHEPELHLAETADEVVRIMTVHSAKGLEFPVVILAKLSGGESGSRAQTVVDRSRGVLEFEVGSRDNRFRTPGFAAAATREDTYYKAEKARLMYVAATRAQDLLVVPVYQSDQSPGMFQHLPQLPSWGQVVDEGLRTAAGGARITLADHFPERELAAAPLPSFPADLAAQWQRQRELRSVHLRAGPTYTTPSQLAADTIKQPRETEPPDRSEPEKDLDRYADTDRALGTADGAAGAAFVGSSAARQRGVLVHEVLYRCDLADPDSAAHWAQRLTADCGAPELAAEVARYADRVLRSPAMPRVLVARRVLRELPLAWYDGNRNTYVEGFVDLAFEEAAGWVIADYKTDALPDGQGGGVRGLLERYHPQVDEYRRAVTATGMPVAACGLWLTATGTLHLW